MKTWSLIDADGHPRDDFQIVDGRIATDETVATNIVLALENHAGAWWFAPEHGSRFAALRQGEAQAGELEAGDLETAAREALVPLERDGRVSDVTVSAQVSAGRAVVHVEAFDPRTGASVQVKIP